MSEGHYMSIRVGDNWRIVRQDQYNIAVQRRLVVKKGKKAGQERWEDIGHYGTLQQAAIALANKVVEPDLALDLKEVSRHVSSKAIGTAIRIMHENDGVSFETTPGSSPRDFRSVGA